MKLGLPCINVKATACKDTDALYAYSCPLDLPPTSGGGRARMWPGRGLLLAVAALCAMLAV